MTNREFSGIVEQYQSLVYTVCYQLVRDHQLAEDLTQETFLSAFTHMDSCDLAKIKPWLVRIAANKATDHLRSAWHRKVSAPGDDAMPEGPPPGTGMPPGPEDLVLTKSETAAICGMVNDLKEPYLLVSRLYFLQQMTAAEIAQRLHRPEKTVRTQLFRAKKILRDKITERSDME